MKPLRNSGILQANGGDRKVGETKKAQAISEGSLAGPQKSGEGIV